MKTTVTSSSVTIQYRIYIEGIYKPRLPLALGERPELIHPKRVVKVKIVFDCRF